MKRTIKRAIVGSVATTLLLPSLAASASSGSFSDVNSSEWYAASVNAMAASNLVFGYPDGTFQPKNQVTRAEFAEMLYTVLGKPSSPGNQGFTDVQSGDWFADAVNYDKSSGIISGIDTTHFAPLKSLTREEASKMVWNLVGYDAYRNVWPDKTKFPNPIIAKTITIDHFADDSSMGSWGSLAVYELAQASVISGYPDHTFAPNASITRAEAARMLYSALQLVGYTGLSTSGGSSSSGTVLNPTSNADNLIKNSDGTYSEGNITFPGTYAINEHISASDQQAILNLMTKVKITINGQDVTFQVPDSGRQNWYWEIGAVKVPSWLGEGPNTLTFKQTTGAGVGLVDHATGAILYDSTLMFKNNAWALNYFFGLTS